MDVEVSITPCEGVWTGALPVYHPNLESEQARPERECANPAVPAVPAGTKEFKSSAGIRDNAKLIRNSKAISFRR